MAPVIPRDLGVLGLGALIGACVGVATYRFSSLLVRTLALVAFLLLAILGLGCATCQTPSITRCGDYGPEVCAGGYWRTVTDCREISSIGGSHWSCEQAVGQVAACMPHGGEP